MKADLPLLDLSSKAGLDNVLAIGIALCVLALLLMCIMAVVLLRMRKGTRRQKGRKGCVSHPRMRWPRVITGGKQHAATHNTCSEPVHESTAVCWRAAAHVHHGSAVVHGQGHAPAEGQERVRSQSSCDLYI